MPGECSPFHGDLIEEVRPSNSVDSMARIAWAAAGGAGGAGGDCSWAELTRALNLIWRTEVSAADLLQPEHLVLLAEKLQVVKENGQVLKEGRVSWEAFHGEHLAPYSFSFFNWFLEAARLTKKHFLGPWWKGLIKGFIGRVEAEQVISRMPKGTFLLRFSDSKPGSISVVHNCSEQGAVSIAPFSDSDLEARSLAATVFDLAKQVNFTWVFPAIPLDEFSEFCEPEDDAAKTSDGYSRWGRKRILANYPKIPKD